jgi:hypothetical protein
MLELGTVYVAVMLGLFAGAALHLAAIRYIFQKELEEVVGTLACAKRDCPADWQWTGEEVEKVAEALNPDERSVTQAELKETRDLVLSLHQSYSQTTTYIYIYCMDF